MKVELMQLKKGETLFIAGTSLGDKVQVGIKGVQSMEFDGKFVIVKCKDVITYVRDFFSITGEKEKPVQHANHHPMKANIASAQVSTPWSGAQVETPISKEPKKPGRPAKFQGQESQ